MTKYFVNHDNSLSEVVVDNPANPLNLEIVDVDVLPGELDECECKDGVVIISQDKVNAKQANLLQTYTQAVQNMLDATAKSKGYDNILSACSYASVENEFQAESIKFVQWRSACWTKANSVLNDVTAGKIQIPSLTDFLSELPKLEL